MAASIHKGEEEGKHNGSAPYFIKWTDN
jgi:hypothetical protein